MLSPKYLQRQAKVNSVADRPRTRDRRRDYDIVQAVTAMLADPRSGRRGRRTDGDARGTGRGGEGEQQRSGPSF